MKLSCRSKSRELDSKNMAITTCGSLESATMFQVALGVEWWHTQPRVRACCLEPRPWWYCGASWAGTTETSYYRMHVQKLTVPFFQNPHIHLCYLNI